MRAVLRKLSPDLLLPAALALAVLVAFSPAWATGRVFHELDTIKQNAPFVEYAAASLRAGELPLWNPYIFTGYPQFADGQTGVLHPLHLPFLLTGAVEPLLVWGPVIRSALAALAAYAFTRTLGVSAAGALLAGLSYGLGSFVIAQQHHFNLANSAIVLPAVLAAWEKAMAAPSLRRYLFWLTLATLAFATVFLALQAQMVLITALGFAFYVLSSLAVFRWRNGPFSQTRWKSFLFPVLGLMSIGFVSAAITAVQILPHMELLFQGLRSEPLSAREAASFAIPPLAWTQLLFPAIFGRGSDYWFSWNPWETSIYFGAIPFAFSLIALFRPSRTVLVLAVLAALALLVAAGADGPIPLFEVLRKVPGFDRMRASGRFSVVACLMVAALAGRGLDVARGRQRSLVAIALATAVLASLGGLTAVWIWLDLAPTAHKVAGDWLLALPGAAPAAGADSPFDRLVRSVNPWRLSNLVPIAAVLLALGALVASRRFSLLRRAFPPFVISLAAAELGFFAATFHPLAPVSALLDPQPFRGAATGPGVYPRTFISEAIDLGSNRLLTARVAEAAGYSPLVPRRIAAVLGAWSENPRRFARVLGVEVAIYGTGIRGGFESWMFKDVSRGVDYSIVRPAFALNFWSPLQDGLIDLPPDVLAREALVVASMDGGIDVPQGGAVATLSWLQGGTVLSTRTLLAGVDLSEKTAFGSLKPRAPSHVKGEVVASTGEGEANVYTLVRAQYFGADRPDQILLRVTQPGVRVTFHGFSIMDDQYRPHPFWAPQLHSFSGPPPVLVAAYDPGPRFELADRIQLVEDSEAALRYMLRGDSEYPRRPAVEPGPWGPSIDQALLAPIEAADDPRSVVLVSEKTTEIALRANSPSPAMLILRDAYFPGWKAFVDGVPAPVLPADVANRAVPVPAGEHTILLRYVPASLRLGAAMSVLSFTLTLAFLVILWQWPRLYGRFRPRPPQASEDSAL